MQRSPQYGAALHGRQHGKRMLGDACKLDEYDVTLLGSIAQCRTSRLQLDRQTQPL